MYSVWWVPKPLYIGGTVCFPAKEGIYRNKSNFGGDLYPSGIDWIEKNVHYIRMNSGGWTKGTEIKR